MKSVARTGVFFRGGWGVSGFVDSEAKMPMPSASDRSTPSGLSWTRRALRMRGTAARRRRGRSDRRAVARALEHAFGDLALAQHDQVGPELLEMFDGGIGMADGKLHPDSIARAYLETHRQDRSAWSFEVDLRPWLERF